MKVPTTVTMRTLSRGAINADPGDLVKLPGDQAAELIAAGYATTETDVGTDIDSDGDAKPTKRRKNPRAPAG